MTDHDGALREQEHVLRAFAEWLRDLIGKPEEPTEEVGGGGEALEAFTDAELEDEAARRATVEGRGTSLITTSTALATLAFAASALVTGADAYVPPRLSLWALGFTFVAFVGAACCGLMAAKSEPTEVVTTEQLVEWRNNDTDIWRNTKDNVSWLLTRAKILKLESLRAGSNAKMNWVKRGWAAQLGALGGLTIAVGAIMAKAIWPDLVGWVDMFLPVPTGEEPPSS